MGSLQVRRVLEIQLQREQEAKQVRRGAWSFGHHVQEVRSRLSLQSEAPEPLR